MEQIVLLEGEDEGRLSQRIQELLQNGGVEAYDTLEWYYIFLRDALNAAALTQIARLTAAYFYNGRTRDRFFRRVAAFIDDLEPHEIEATTFLLTSLRPILADPAHFIHVKVEADKDAFQVRWLLPDANGQDTRRDVPWSGAWSAAKTVRLLQGQLDLWGAVQENRHLIADANGVRALRRLVALFAGGTSDEILGPK